MSRKTPKLVESARTAFENHFGPLFWAAVGLGFILRLLATYAPLSNFSSGLAEFCKEAGNFILSVFLVAFLYENFINYKNRQEAFLEMEELLNRRLGSGIRHVYERRPTLALKANFVKDARHEVIELGVALNRFKEYVVGNMAISDAPGSLGYRDHLEALMQHGVQIHCFATNAEFMDKVPDGCEFAAKIRRALPDLERYIDSLQSRGYRGGMTLYQYRHNSHFAAIMVDPDDPENGKALISPYITLRENNMAPFFEIYRKDSEAVFMAYYSFVQRLKQEQDDQHEHLQTGATAPPIATK